MLSMRLSDEDRALLDELVRRQTAELATRGVEVSVASVLRGLVRQAAVEAGIKVPSPSRAKR